ncbi:MAG: RNA methyltransferase [Candidatus Bipolaricaulis sibiricus]|uniref:RNA methyltransferase n=1 Tax=Bipolaricaulis sibiricus TaxID=2501609 RepID=A0A410FU81_BIPS1|nr:MAG: RNA methyltransferase [Candidatus Bipolaricaulis sibiricus]
MANLYVALLHFPMHSREGEIVATALTSMNVPDIARTARTYGVSRYYVVTPLATQRRIAERLCAFWMEEESLSNRREAVALVAVREDLEECYHEVSQAEGRPPLVWGTSARSDLPYPRLSWEQARAQLRDSPVLLLFGTGNGMANELLAACDALLPPVRARGYNYLSVRAAVAIILDRLKGEEV